jgi:hypothetical protein
MCKIAELYYIEQLLSRVHISLLFSLRYAHVLVVSTLKL